jgi:two-component system, OmpR family, response regulator
LPESSGHINPSANIMRILLVSPPHAEAAYLQKALQECAHSLQRADDCRDGVFVASQEPFDAIVTMAIEPPSYPMLFDALPQFGTALNSPAIVAVLGTANAAERTRVLRAGADACFTRPYSFIEMHERIQVLYRTSAVSDGPNIRHTPHLDAMTRDFVDGNHRLPVTMREYLLLECLLRHSNAPVPRDQLIRYAWPDKEDVDPASVNLVVSRLRRKLEQRPSSVRIETVSRYGYQLIVQGA